MINDKIYSALKNAANLIAAGAVIRPIVLRQGDPLPAITYKIDTEHDYAFEGQTNYKTATLEINCYASKLPSAKTMALDVNYALTGLVGVDGNVTFYSVKVTREIEDFETELDEFRINQQFVINFKEE